MREPEENREEKLEGRDVRFGAAARTDRPHGKVYRWLDNFWYHHKWKTIIITFFLVVIVICTVQMCKKGKGSDVSLLIVGPTNFTDTEAGFSQLEGLLSSRVPEDYNGDGTKSTDIIYYTVYSEEQIAALKEHVNEKGESDPIYVNTSVNSENYKQYNSHLMTGETVILLLDPWLFEERQDTLADLSGYFEQAPAGAVYVEGEDGAQHLLGVRLGDTALYQNNSAYRVLPEDTVVCMLSKLVTVNEQAYANAAAYVVELVK